MTENSYGTDRPIDPLYGGAEARSIPSERAGRERQAGGEPSLGQLITGLLSDLQDLVRGEVKLARTEIMEDLRAVGQAAGMLAGAAIVGIVGAVILALAATYGLDTWLEEMWLSALIVGAVLALFAAILAATGKSRLSAAGMKPEQTIESLKEDQEWAKQRVSSVRR